MQTLYCGKCSLTDTEPSWMTATFYNHSSILIASYVIWYHKIVYMKQRELSVKAMISLQKREKDIGFIAEVADGISSQLW